MELQLIDDATLVDLCRAKPAAKGTLTELVTRYGPLVLQTITWTFRRYCRDRESEAADVFQQVFVSLFEDNGRRLEKYNPSISRLSTYLAAAARNAALNALGGERAGMEEFIDNIADESALPDTCAERAELMEKIGRQLSAFTAKERLFYHLYFEEYMPPETVARVMGVSVESVHSKKAKIIDKLRQRLNAAVNKE
jgi:RNA polymerase sigma-70 factor (ECF subfamily)